MNDEKRPSFILRDIDPDLWRKVKSKAALEGETVKNVILKLLAKWVGLGLVVLLVGCNPIAVAPTSPSVVPPVVVESPPPVLPQRPPVTLMLSQSPQQGVVAGDGVSLSATALSGELLAPASYAWTFGDGTTQTTSTASTGHVYPNAGSYATAVTVRDRDGRTADASRTVVVASRPSPPRDPPPPKDPPPSLGVRLTCTPKTAPVPTPCNVTVTWDGATLRSQDVRNVDWDWGDGEFESTPGPSQSHPYAQGGSYTIFAAVTADTTKGSQTAERQVTIIVP